jgi:hypothetical protein
MKYIRTKDNIFEVENENPNNIIFCKPRHTKMLVKIDENVYEMKNIIIEREIGKDHWEDEIINRADTIEELCDRWVEISNDEVYQIGYFYVDFEKMELPPLKQINPINKKRIKVEIYGAIWTKWGLKYVAKMNDKGELELL